MPDEIKRLSALIHGVPKIGKTRLAATSPGPVVFLDSEGGTQYLDKALANWAPKRLNYWRDLSQPPPRVAADGSPLGVDDLVIVRARDWSTATQLQSWMLSGDHPFRSFVVDTATELQLKTKEAIAAGGSFTDNRQWGELKDKGLMMARQWRDLLDHPTNPLYSVIILAHSDLKNDMQRPMLEGALAKSIGGYYDVIGYFRPWYREDGVPSRELLIAPFPGIEAGDRTGMLSEHFPNGVIREPNILNLIRIINGAPANG